MNSSPRQNDSAYRDAGNRRQVARSSNNPRYNSQRASQSFDTGGSATGRSYNSDYPTSRASQSFDSWDGARGNTGNSRYGSSSAIQNSDTWDGSRGNADNPRYGSSSDIRSTDTWDGGNANNSRYASSRPARTAAQNSGHRERTTDYRRSERSQTYDRPRQSHTSQNPRTRTRTQRTTSRDTYRERVTDDRYAGRSSQSSARSNNPRNGGRRGYGAPTSRNVPPAYDQYATSSYAPDNYRFLSVKRSRFPRFALLAVAAVVAVVIVGGVAWGIAGGQILANPDKDAAVETAAALATQYDYDGAIDTLNAYASEHNDDSLAETIEDYEAQRAALVPVDNDEITHVFYHSLVKDPSLAFANPDDELTAGFAQWMTTIDEYNAITQQMYDRGYVLVGLDDMYTETVDEDGTVHFEPKEILLPPDKKPFVLSLDDLSYYHSYDNRGIASKLVLDENGNVICEYIEQDGTVTYGAFDVVPLLEEFIAAHPDFAYKNARGTIALTGYNGIFGYRTDPAYEAGDPENLADDQIAWLEDHPDFDYDAECDQAKAVADALKAKGWTMASHTWGHMNISTIKLDSLKRDTQRWKESVEPLVGQTEKIIFAHGVDMSPTGVYNDDNEKYSFLKSQGFNVFCIVDGSKPYTLDITDAYVHQGRRNLDGYRMYHDLMTESVENRLTGDLFTVEEVIDPARPLDAKLYDLG